MRVRVHATIRPIVGGRFVDLPVGEGATVRELVACMVGRWPELAEMMWEEGELSRRVHVFVDGRSSRHLPDGSDTVLREGQEIDVSPAVAGG
ncbi:MAG: MoaD/ThiS family protein [Deltaproteobacteria bacterium]|jgi:molybdopterin synthase sulfur carrier subunit|nr:MoaD/ThiS family protein [Deltaproteobacteria bacterium]MBW2498340.1 MoaD/ThiS family protein [Deltaproteobacteria bacterium]